MFKLINLKYILLLLSLSLLFSACKQSSPNPPKNPSLSSNISLNNSSQPQIKLASSGLDTTITMNSTASEVIEKDNQTVFKNIAPHTDAVYQKIDNGIKEDIILFQKPDTPPIYQYILSSKELRPYFFEGQYYFFDKNGRSQLTIPKPFMIDQNNARSEAIKITINSNILTIIPDSNWLSDPQRQYPITIDPSVIVPNSPLIELPERRTLSSKTFDLGNGKFATTSDGQALHYQDEHGQWQDKDTSLVPSTDPEYDFMNLTNSYQTFFSTDGFGQKKAVKFQVKDAWMKFKISHTSGQGETDNIANNKFNFTQIAKSDNNILAANYTLETNQLLEEIVLNKFQGYPTITQEIELHNAILKTNGKKIDAYHSTTNELLWTIPEPVMYEVASPEIKNYGLHYEINCTNSDCSTLLLSKIIDHEGQVWLSDPIRNYPLVIDLTAGPNSPSTVIDGGGGSLSWISPNNAQTSNDIYTNTLSYPQNESVVTNYLKATNFGFSIPSNATITGIVAEIEKKASPYNNLYYLVADKFVGLVIADSFGKGDRSNFSFWSTTDSYTSYGSSADLWDNSLTPTDINSTDFGLILMARAEYCSTGNCWSLEENSLVSTLNGYQKIKDLQIGDQVLSYNESTHQIEPKTILGVYSHPITDNHSRYFYIYYRNQVIKATENHKFFVNGSYLRADQLQVGDLLLDTNLNQYPIQKIKIVPNSSDTVWNITVADNHNFFVNNILTHNDIPVFYVDHMRLTVYYQIISSVFLEGIKMEGVQIN